MAQKQDESLKDKLLQMELEDQKVIFIIDKGEKFIGRPETLAKKLGIDVKLAEKALVELKSHKEKQISSELERLKQLVKENPDTSLEDVVLLNEIDDYVVSAYLDSLKTKELTESQKGVIKGKHNAGFSIKEIAEHIKESQITVREYVEQNYITFDGADGKRILEIIYKNFGEQPVMKLKEMILNKNVKLQEKICWDLKETNPKEYEEVKQYFEKFKESQNFFEIDDTLSNEAKKCIRASTLEDIDELSTKLNRVRIVIRSYLLQFSPDKLLIQDYAQEKMEQIQDIYETFGSDKQISRITYRMIISDSFEILIQQAKTSEESHQFLTNFYLLHSFTLKEVYRSKYFHK